MIRLIRGHPGFVALATLVLSVSLGLNLVVLTVVNALWIRPLPFPDPDQVVTLPRVPWLTLDSRVLHILEGGVAGQVVTSGKYEGLRPRVDVAAVGRDLEVLGVTSTYFSVLRLPIRGRDFQSNDDQDSAEPVAIISDQLWGRSFGRSPDVIGAVLSAKPFAIKVIGVAPPGFHGAQRGEQVDLWIPAALVRRLGPPGWAKSDLSLMAIGRLGSDQTIANAQRRLEDEAPDIVRWFQTAVTPLADVYGTPDSGTLEIREGSSFLVAAGLAALVLLGGCATIAALVLMHYERRRTELALKLSLGIGRGRLARELVGELLVIAATGSASGLLVAALGAGLIPALSLPGGVNIARLDLSIDWRVCIVAIATTVLTLSAAAVVPIMRSTRLRLAGELFTGQSTTLGSLRVRQALLGIQICTTVIVLIAAGLFVRAVNEGLGKGAGFDVDRTVFVSVQEERPFRNPVVDSDALIAERGGRLATILARLPGVDAVAEAMSPIGPDALLSNARPKIFRTLDRQHSLFVGHLRGTPNLLSTLGIPLLSGRSLILADATARPVPCVISLSLAVRLWPSGNALGQTLTWAPMRGGPYVIVGIARDFAFGSLNSPGAGVVVSVGPGNSSIVSSFVIRTDHPEIVSGLLARTVQGQVVRVATGREVVARDIGRQRLGAWVFSGFGLVALLLGIGGAFGLVSYLAESQRREFGVRLALGADSWSLVRHALFAVFVPVSLGIGAGLALGGALSQLFKALLVGLRPLDLLTYIVVALTILSCAILASLAAAWRLRRTAPSDALRAT